MGEESLFAQLITKEMAALAGAAITIMLVVGRVPFKDGRLNKTKFWKGWGIVLLMSLCVGGAFIPGIRPEGEVGTVIVFGLLSTLAAHVGKKLLAPMFLTKLEGKKE